MDVSIDKYKIMVNSSGTADAEIAVNGGIHEEVKLFKYLGAILTEDSSSDTEMKARIGAAADPLP